MIRSLSAGQRRQGGGGGGRSQRRQGGGQVREDREEGGGFPPFLTLTSSLPLHLVLLSLSVLLEVKLSSLLGKCDPGLWENVTLVFAHFPSCVSLCVVFRYAETLVQLDNGVKVPPSGWKCGECDLTTHLWMNLTDGSVHCGRHYFDGEEGREMGQCFMLMVRREGAVCLY